ncbi:hypothetical protein X777_15014, partial [Ooceraea biroi]
ENLKWLEEYCNMPLRDVRTPPGSRKSVRRENRHSLISCVSKEGERGKKEAAMGRREDARGWSERVDEPGSEVG